MLDSQSYRGNHKDDFEDDIFDEEEQEIMDVASPKVIVK